MGEFFTLSTVGDGNCFWHALLGCIDMEYLENRSRSFRTQKVIALKNKISRLAISTSSADPVESVRKILETIQRDKMPLKVFSRKTKKEVRSTDDDLSLGDLIFITPKGKSFDITNFGFSRNFKGNERCFVYNNGNLFMFSLMNQLALLDEGIPSAYLNEELDSTLLNLETAGAWAQESQISLISYIRRINIIVCFTLRNNVGIQLIHESSPNYPTVFISNIKNMHYESAGVVVDGRAKTIFYPGIEEDLKIINAAKKFLTSGENKKLHKYR